LVTSDASIRSDPVRHALLSEKRLRAILAPSAYGSAPLQIDARRHARQLRLFDVRYQSVFNFLTPRRVVEGGARIEF
jgi:hypothetical protein